MLCYTFKGAYNKVNVSKNWLSTVHIQFSFIVAIVYYVYENLYSTQTSQLLYLKVCLFKWNELFVILDGVL